MLALLLLAQMLYPGSAVAFSTNTTKARILDASGATLSTVTMPSDSYSCAYDPVNGAVWVPGYTAGSSVTRIKLSDYSTTSYTVGLNPYGAVYDAANGAMWVSNSGANTITKLTLSGALVGTYAVSSTPLAMTIAQGVLWVACAGINSISKLRLSDGSPQGWVALAAGTTLIGMATDGAWVWGADGSANHRVVAVSATTSAVLYTAVIPNDSQQMAYDPASDRLWIASYGASKVNVIAARTGTALAQYTISSARGVALDDAGGVWIGPETAAYGARRLAQGSGVQLAIAATDIVYRAPCSIPRKQYLIGDGL